MKNVWFIEQARFGAKFFILILFSPLFKKYLRCLPENTVRFVKIVDF
jgi:hypothetical protein